MKRILLALAMTVCAADEVEQPPPDESFHAKAAEIIALMIEVRESLRNDCVHKTVQIKGKDIEDKLDKLIEEIEVSQDGDGAKDGKRGLKDNKPRRVNLTQNDRDWLALSASWSAELRSVRRDVILQVYRAPLPVRWRERIAAYFVSIAADEARREEAYRKR